MWASQRPAVGSSDWLRLFITDGRHIKPVGVATLGIFSRGQGGGGSRNQAGNRDEYIASEEPPQRPEQSAHRSYIHVLTAT